MFIILQIFFATRADLKIGEYINNSLHLARKYARTARLDSHLSCRVQNVKRQKLTIQLHMVTICALYEEGEMT